MNTSSTRRLVQMVTQSHITDLQVETEPTVRLLVCNGASFAVCPITEMTAMVAATGSPQALHPPTARQFVTSPLVGTCRLSMSNKDIPLVRCGERIEAGQVLCAIEAMGLKHEIPSSTKDVLPKFW